MLVKLLIFYVSGLLLIAATVFFAILYPPKLIVTASMDDAERVIRCKLRLKRSFRPARVFLIEISRPWAETLGASPPAGFKKKRVRRKSRTTGKDLRPSKRSAEWIEWKGEATIPPRTDFELTIPFQHARPGTGRVRFVFESRLLAGSLGGGAEAVVEG